MNKEEQEAIEFIKKMETETQIENVQIILNKENTKYFKTILELINRQQQELEILKNCISKGVKNG